MNSIIRFLLGILIFGTSAQAKLFSNSYVSFELPPNWDCQREGTEWTCVSQFSQKSKEAIIILTAKEVGPNDSIERYQAHLKEPRLLPNKSGPPIPSKVVSVQTRMISNHSWIDALHLGSEVTTYYTRYLATVKDRVGILVTFSAHRSQYAQYANDFIRAIESLKVTTTKNIATRAAGAAPGKPNETIGQPIPPGGGSNFETFPTEDQSGGSKSLKKLLGLALIILGLGIYIFMKSRSKKAKK